MIRNLAHSIVIVSVVLLIVAQFQDTEQAEAERANAEWIAP